MFTSIFAYNFCLGLTHTTVLCPVKIVYRIDFSLKGFWAVDDDSQVLRAIHEGFIQTHLAMRREVAQWPKTSNGLPSTAGTTASVAFIRRGKIYVGHVGDSAIVIGAQSNHDPNVWEGTPLTRDHKPESEEEQTRIERAGGKVVSKSGVPRVVWNRYGLQQNYNVFRLL